MCSELILLAYSCYIDNFDLIFSVVGRGLVMGMILGAVVGILLLFVKNLKE